MTASLNDDHLEIWLRTLETTDKPQVKAHLCAVDDDNQVGFCCLGIGSVLAGLVPEWSDVDPSAPGNYAYLADEADLAPVEFITWLGLEPEDEGGAYDIILDYTHEMPKAEPDYGVWMLRASSLNDWGLTFPQIAQMIRYFGVKGAR